MALRRGYITYFLSSLGLVVRLNQIIRNLRFWGGEKVLKNIEGG